LPDDFDERYRKYRERLLEDEPRKTDPKEVEESVIIPQTRFSKNDEATEAMVGEKQENSTAIFDVPLGTTWNELIIKFKDEQTVEAYKGEKYLGVADFKRMGFGSKRPDQRWRFLHLLATIYATNPSNNPSLMPTAIDDLAHSLLGRVSKPKKQQIQTLKTELSSQLRKAFGIDNESFEDYGQWHYYKTKFKLKPEPELRNENPYEAAKQLHEGVERIGSDDPHLEKLSKRRLSDEDNAEEFESEDEAPEDEDI
jgi:hypothetical protein